MKLKSALLMILLWAFASGSVLARGGQSQSFMRPSSPMLQGGQVQSTVRSGCTLAHNRQFHHHFRSPIVIVGSPFFYYPYPYPYYYYPPVAYAPQDYIEEEGAAPDQSQAYWYYCAGAKAYYPYVKECPGGWQRVAPPPPPVSNY